MRGPAHCNQLGFAIGVQVCCDHILDRYLSRLDQGAFPDPILLPIVNTDTASMRG